MDTGHASLSPLAQRTAYRNGCRCESCTAALARWNAAYRKRRILGIPSPAGRVPALGTRRRILALGVVGYSQRQIAAETGILQREVTRIVTGQQRAVYRRTEQAVRDVYARLSQPPYPRRTSGASRASRAALANGGAAPAAWDDEDLDRPEGRPYTAAEEQRPRVTAEEVERLLWLNFTLGQIAADYGVKPDGVMQAMRRQGRPDLCARLFASDADFQHEYNTSRRDRPHRQSRKERVA